MDCRRYSGFTLPELVTTLATVSILISVAAPSFIEFVAQNRLASQLNLFVRAVNLSRSEAIKRNQRVLICPTSAGQCSDTSDWHLGGSIYVDRDGDSAIDPGELIGGYSALTKGYSLTPNITTTALRFSGDGTVRRSTGALPLSTFRLCAPGAKPGNLRELSREIVINASGRMRIQRGREGITGCF